MTEASVQTYTESQETEVAREFSPDGRVAALGSFDNAVSVHATHTGALLRQIVVQNDGIAKMLFSNCGRFLLLGTATGKLQLVAL
jgi:hypothetical protein